MFGDDGIQRDIVGLRNQLPELSSGSGHANCRDAADGQGAVIETAAVAQAPAARVEPDAGDDQQIRLYGHKRIG